MDFRKKFVFKQKFFAYEFLVHEYKDGNFECWFQPEGYQQEGYELTPRLLQVVDGKTLKRALEYISEEGYRGVPNDAGFSSPFCCDYGESSPLYTNPYPTKRSLIYYELPNIEKRFSALHASATEYHKATIFLSDLKGKMCTVLHHSPTVFLLSSLNEPDVYHTYSGELEQWDFYRELDDAKLFAVPIDEYQDCQAFFRYYLCDEEEYDSGECYNKLKIGQEWCFNKKDIALMDPHDLLYFFYLYEVYLLDYLYTNEEITDLSNGDYDDYSKIACVFWIADVEDDLYFRFCKKWNDESTGKRFKEHLTNLILEDSKDVFRNLGNNNFGKCMQLRYLKQVHYVVKTMIAPFKSIWSNILYNPNDEKHDFKDDTKELYDFIERLINKYGMLPSYNDPISNEIARLAEETKNLLAPPKMQ
ncbi:MAG: hypothetical protein IJZ82_10905 [Lachnospiraceae bacterium]|nr:hypothetical protein [Lachnospiraceae bacterium]